MFGATKVRNMDQFNLLKELTLILSTKDNDFIVSPSRNCSEVASVFDNTETVSYILRRFVKKYRYAHSL
jgi:hypothetical protein